MLSFALRTSLTMPALAAMVAASVGTAAPASAVTATTTITCDGSSNLVASTSLVDISSFDTLAVVNSATGGDLLRTATPSGVTGAFTVANNATQNYTTAAGLLTFTSQGGACVNDTVTVTLYSGGGSSGGGSSGSGSTPAPLVQEFGKPAFETCDAAAPVTLNWGGVTSGGWGESWAQWMNGGLGGAVCTRTLVYSTSQSRWVVG